MNAARARYLETAFGIARYLVTTAIWHEDRCNWMGGYPEEGPGGFPLLTYRSLGLDLYGGTAGVGLFLAEVAAITGDRDLRATALGALHHAIGRAGSPAARDLGLYSGLTGVAYALTRAGQVLGNPGLVDAARVLIEAVEFGEDSTRKPECDLMTGLAGQALGCLVLRHAIEIPRAIEGTLRCAEKLLQLGESRDGRLAWPSASMQGAPRLLGFSHGASGIAVVLLELHRVTGDLRFRVAAEAALAYERDYYDEAARNWPDLRQTARSGTGQHSFGSYWCHGAPGIALARLRALELGLSSSLEREAAVGLETTERMVRAAVDSGAGNYSLCHGILGNAEVLLEGQAVRPDVAWLDDVAESAARTYAAHPEAWPCGVPGASTPGLFLGLSGIGHFYIRRAYPEVPSVLLLRPSGSAADRERPAIRTEVSVDG